MNANISCHNLLSTLKWHHRLSNFLNVTSLSVLVVWSKEKKVTTLQKLVWLARLALEGNVTNHYISAFLTKKKKTHNVH